MLEWLSSQEVAEGLRQLVSRGDVLRLDVSTNGDAMLRVRFQGIEPVHVQDAVCDAEAMMKLIDTAPGAAALRGVAFYIQGGEKLETVDDAVGGESGLPFGVSSGTRT